MTGGQHEACADAAKCPRWAECREAKDRAIWGPAYEDTMEYIREIVADASPLSPEQRDRIAMLLTPPPGPRPPLPCPHPDADAEG